MFCYLYIYWEHCLPLGSIRICISSLFVFIFHLYVYLYAYVYLYLYLYLYLYDIESIVYLGVAEVEEQLAERAAEAD